MEILKEVTDWEWPNHTYLLDAKGYLIAYIKEGQDEINKVSRLPFSKTRRKFVKVNDEKLLEQFGRLSEEPILNADAIVPTESFQSWTVDGSKGNTYIVELIGDKYHCNCAGYGFRGKCKHSQQIKEQNESAE